MFTAPTHVLAAPAHPNPYPFYADLATRAPFVRDEALQLWIAAGAGPVLAALTHPLARVRPLDQPIPPALRDTPVATIFGQLVRMRDDRARQPLRATLIASLDALRPLQIAERSAVLARVLAADATSVSPSTWLSDFIWRLPVCVVASLLGAPEADLPQVATWLHDLVVCLRPNADPATVAPGSAAALELRAYVGELLTETQEALGLSELARAATRGGHDAHDAMVANAVGLLMQSYEATAGLIGNTVLALASRPDLQARVQARPGLLPPMLLDVLRFDPPIHNTRRFLAQDAQIAGHTVRAGDTVLVVLAAANYDPTVNSDPAPFDSGRTQSRSFSFGVGGHACPGEQLALGIATAGVRQILAFGPELKRMVEGTGYWPLPNARVPRFDGPLPGSDAKTGGYA